MKSDIEEPCMRNDKNLIGEKKKDFTRVNRMIIFNSKQANKKDESSESIHLNPSATSSNLHN